MPEQAGSYPNYLLRNAREARGWSQDTLAQMIGTTARSVMRWEQGQTTPYPHYRRQLCEVFGETEPSLGLDGGSQGIKPRTEQAPGWGVLPASPTDFVGRDEDLTVLRAQLLVQIPLAIIGPPGMGKTALAQTLAHDPILQEHFPDGIFWGALGSHGSLPKMVNVLGKALGFSAKRLTAIRNENLLAALREAIGERALLLILDDVWDEQIAMTFFQVGGPRCCWLMTSRFRHIALALVGEKGTYPLRELTTTHGVQLLQQLAPTAVQLDPQGITALAQAMGGLPLGLRLLGATLQRRVISGQVRQVQTVLERFQHPQDRLAITMALPDHDFVPQSLQMAIASSESLLDQSARAAWYALAILPAKPASFTETAALTVALCQPATLDLLHDCSLLEYSDDGRYCMHQILHDYALLQLKASGAEQEKDASVRFLLYTIHYLHQTKDIQLLAVETPMILAAMEAAQTLGRSSEFLQLVLLFTPTMLLHGWIPLAEWHLQRAYDIATTLHDTSSLIAICLALGRVQQKLGQQQAALVLWQEGLALARSVADEPAICDLLAALCELLSFNGAIQLLTPYLEEGLPLALRLGHQESLCTLLRIRAFIELAQGNYVQTQLDLEQGLSLVTLHNQSELPFFYLGLAYRPVRLGEYALAESYFQQGLRAAAWCEEKQAMCLLLTHRVIMNTVRNPQGELRNDLDRALSLAQEMHDLGSQVLIFHVWSLLALALHDIDEAEKQATQGLSYATRLQAPNLHGLFLVSLASIALLRQQILLAGNYLTEAAPLLRMYGQREDVGRMLSIQGELAFLKHEWEAAFAAFQEMLKIAPAEHLALRGEAHWGLARVAEAQNKKQEAKHQGEESLRLFQCIQHFKAQEVQHWLRTKTIFFRKIFHA